jgi:hypothetical protein
MIKLLIAITSAAVVLVFTCSNITCTSHQQQKNISNSGPKPLALFINPSAKNVSSRFMAPENYVRTKASNNSFANFLRQLPLKTNGSLVKYYSGATKANNNVYAAIIDLPIGTKDLHQCADAVMYLHAKYLFSEQKYDEIKFKFLGDEKMHYYTDYTKEPSNEKVFFKYIQEVWSAANTRSLHDQLKSKTLEQASVGDVLIVKGNPYGHAVQIIDECINTKTGKKLFMLAQSYMPAQETQILLNAHHPELGVWYDFTSDEEIYTPEWTFPKTALRTW